MQFHLIPASITMASKLFGAFPLETSSWSLTFPGLACSMFMLIGGLTQLYYSGPTIKLCVQDVQKSSTDMVNLSFVVLMSLSNIGSKFSAVFLLKSHLRKICSKVRTVDEYFESVYSMRNNKWAGLGATVVFLIYTFVITPINISKLIQFFRKGSPWDTILFYAFLYLQNISAACTELQYISLAFNLHQRFGKINKVLKRIWYNVNTDESEIMRLDLNSPKCYSSAARKARKITPMCKLPCDCTTVTDSCDGFEVFEDSSTCSPTESRQIETEKIENLRFCHLSTREALMASYKLYRVQFFFSISTCFSLTVLELYYGFILGKHARLKPKIVFWLLQFSLRFCVPTIASQATTNEAIYGRTLIAKICNKMKDADCVEELKLLSDDIKNCNMEFSVFGFFTVNSRLITSAIAAGSTYLVILIQFSHNSTS